MFVATGAGRSKGDCSGAVPGTAGAVWSMFLLRGFPGRTSGTVCCVYSVYVYVCVVFGAVRVCMFVYMCVCVCVCVCV